LTKWTGEEGADSCQALTFDGEHIYVGLANPPPARVVKLDPEDMTVQRHLDGQRGPGQLPGFDL